MYLGYNTPKHWKNPVNNEVVFKGISAYQVFVYRCFLKWWYPQNTPKWSSLVGKPVVVGYHHFRKPPYTHKNLGYPINVPLLWGWSSAHFTLQQSWSKIPIVKQTVIRLMGSEIRRAPVEGKVVFFPLFIGFLQTSKRWLFGILSWKHIVYWFFHFADTPQTQGVNKILM